jgi:hypothetical protein
MGKMVYVPDKKIKGDNNHWPQKKRFEVVTSYLATGNLRLAASIHDVSYNTVVFWKRCDWWNDMIREIQSTQNIKTDHRITKIVDKTMEAINDRLDNGDPILDSKTGKVIRIPPKLRDVKSVAKDLMDQQRFLRKEINGNQNEKEKETINNRLLNLAEKFAEMASGKKAQEPITIEDGQIISETHLEQSK